MNTQNKTYIRFSTNHLVRIELAYNYWLTYYPVSQQLFNSWYFYLCQQILLLLYKGIPGLVKEMKKKIAKSFEKPGNMKVMMILIVVRALGTAPKG